MNGQIDFKKVADETGVTARQARDAWHFMFKFIADTAVQAVAERRESVKFILPGLGWYVLDKTRQANKEAAAALRPKHEGYLKKEEYIKLVQAQYEKNEREEAAPDVHGGAANDGQGPEA